MNARSHNHLEACWFDYKTGNISYFHYNELMIEDSRTFKVSFSREVTSIGITVKIISIEPPASLSETTEIETHINELNCGPKDGFECQTLGWAYLGNITTNPFIQTQIDAAKANGNEFNSIYYRAGYSVFGCPAIKQFYDKT